MSVVNKIISAIGNNNSIYPLLVRDCGIEIPVKVYKTYNQNKQDNEIAYLAARERIIDEYATSAVWLGGIPLIDKISDYFIRKKQFNPDISVKLYNEYADVQGIKYNIEKFKNIKGAEEAVKDLEYALKNQTKYKKLQCSKFLAAMAIPIVLMGFIIPKLVFAMTENTRAKKQQLQKKQTSSEFLTANTAFTSRDVFDKVTLNNPQKISFKGNFAGAVCNLRTVDKMAITDGGYAIGRVTTARKKYEAIDLGFKMTGMMYLNFIAPKQLEKLLNKIAKSVSELNLNLDPVILADKRLQEQVLNGTLVLPKDNSAKELLNFIDDKKNSNSLFMEYAKRSKKIKMLDCGVRDPRAYVNTDELGKFRDNFEIFISKIKELQACRTDKKRIGNFIRKAKVVKTFNILANVAISSYLLASVLPDAQFAFRKLVTGSKLEPGLIQ